MKHFKKLTSRGDTIVEVLIVLAILGLSFAISTATASRGISQSRNAQEHSEALGVLNTQVSYLRNAVQQQINLSALPSAFCFDYSTGNPQVTPIATPNNYASYPAACKNGTLYTVRISLVGTSPDDGYYDIRVNWDGVNSLGPQQEKMFYRVHQLTSQDDTGIGLGSEAAQIHAGVKKILPNPITKNGPNPSTCSLSNPQQDKGGSTVTLTGGGDPAQVQANIPAGGYTFQNLREPSTYTVTVSSINPGYTLCGANTRAVSTAGGGVKQAEFYIAPQCSSFPKRDYLGYYSDYQGYFSDYLGYYSDYWGYYGDPYTVYWEDHIGSSDGYFSQSNGSYFWGGNGLHYHWYSNSNVYPGQAWYTAWQHKSGTAYTAPYDHYSGPYDHYTAPYDHWSAPYDHYSAYYTWWNCTP